jgi:hypothetical protein
MAFANYIFTNSHGSRATYFNLANPRRNARLLDPGRLSSPKGELGRTRISVHALQLWYTTQRTAVSRRQRFVPG